VTELYLHIGSNKAGSTALQAFAAANRDQLKARGIHYPRAGANAMGAHHPLCLTFLDLAQPINAVFRRQLLDRDVKDGVLREIDGAERVLISSEALFWVYGLDRDAVMRFLGAFDRTVVIVYLRRHDAYMESMYKSRAVVGDALPTFAKFCEQMDRDYWDIVEQWRKIPGVEQVVVRPFVPQAWANQDLFVDFLSAVDRRLADESWSAVSERNDAQPLPVVDALIRLNHAGVVQSRQWIPLLRELTAAFRVPDGAGYLTEPLQRTLSDRYTDSDRRLATAYWSTTEADAYFSQSVAATPYPYQGLTEEQWSQVLTALRQQGLDLRPMRDPQT
jgi:hypothetical protein